MAFNAPLFKIDTAILKSALATTTTVATVTKASVLSDALARDRPSVTGVIAGAGLPVPVVLPPPPVAVDIAKDSALGKVRETIAVAKRLETSPSVEFRNIANAAKQRFFIEGIDILTSAGISLDDIPVRGYALALNNPPQVTGATATPAAGSAPRTVPLEDVIELRQRLTARPGDQLTGYKAFYVEDKGKEGAQPVKPENIQLLDLEASEIGQDEMHEATLFARGLDSIDSVVFFLRNVETRMDAYRVLQGDAIAARSRLQAVMQRLATEIGNIETELAEVRHDLAVARSLRAEEAQRVARLIERRKGILAEHVPFLVFRRPLFTRHLDNSPVRAAEPALIDDPVPAARAQTDELLPELAQMIDTLREVPARWFRKAIPVFDKFDRVQHIEKLVSTAVERIESIVTKGNRRIAFESDGSKAAQQLRATFDGHEQRLLKTADTARSLFVSMQADSARNALALVRGVASVSDLIRCAPVTREVTLAAAGLLDDIGNVAQALYEMFSEVPPANRLRWAEMFSELDPRVPLRQLTVLPDYGNEAIGVDFIQWRQMQKLVDWLFLQVDADDDAVAAINDLVRVCLLLSAHAPVKRIISARIKRPVPAIIDTRFELELDPKVARIGMQVLVHAPQTNTVVARALVEDIGAGGGFARITQVMTATATTIDASHRVMLQSGPALSSGSAARADSSQATPQQAQVRGDAQAQRELRGAGGKTAMLRMR
jgi:hypothetical protein